MKLLFDAFIVLTGGLVSMLALAGMLFCQDKGWLPLIAEAPDLNFAVMSVALLCGPLFVALALRLEQSDSRG